MCAAVVAEGADSSFSSDLALSKLGILRSPPFRSLWSGGIRACVCVCVVGMGEVCVSARRTGAIVGRCRAVFPDGLQ